MKTPQNRHKEIARRHADWHEAAFGERTDINYGDVAEAFRQRAKHIVAIAVAADDPFAPGAAETLRAGYHLLFDGRDDLSDLCHELHCVGEALYHTETPERIAALNGERERVEAEEVANAERRAKSRKVSR